MTYLTCFVLGYGAPRDRLLLTHSFPTRRSSDLGSAVQGSKVKTSKRGCGRAWSSGRGAALAAEEQPARYCRLAFLHCALARLFLGRRAGVWLTDRKSTRLNSSH